MRKKLSTRYKKQRAAAKKVWKRKGLSDEIGFKEFWRKTQDRMIGEGLSASSAAKKYANTEKFVDAATRSRKNLIDTLRKDFNAEFKELVKLNRETRVKGKFVSMKKNMVWSKEFNAYVLGGRYIIDVSNSPKEVIITDMNDVEGVYNAGQK